MDATLALGRALGRVVENLLSSRWLAIWEPASTTFAQGVGIGLELSSAVVSPTFILMAEHPDGRLPLLHGDAYRLKPGEAEAIGLDETIDTWPGLVLMEWGDLIPDVFDGPHLRVNLAHAESGRSATIEAVGADPEALLRAWKTALDG